MKFLFPLSVISCLVLQLFGQDTTAYLRGKIYAEYMHLPVFYCHITNLNMGVGTVSDKMGVFQIPYRLNDVIQISHVGFYDYVYVASKSADDLTNPVQILLKAKTYTIKEVNVFPFKDYSDFKQKFIEMEIKEYEDDKIRNIIFNHPEMTPEHLKQLHDAANPGATIQYKSSIEKQEEALEKHIEDEKTLNRNRLRVRTITKLDSMELNLFIQHCRFDIEYLKNASEYEIYINIKDKFRQYKKQLKKNK